MNRDFAWHLGLYLVVNVVLFLIDYYDVNGETHDQWWFYWTTLFWGIGLCIHGIDTYFGSRKK